jgi:hypothetical protein
LTDRHHALPFAEHGETAITYPLCPNCHGILHLILSVHYRPTERNQKIWAGVQSRLGHQNTQLQKVLALAWEHIDLLDDHRFSHLDVDFGDPLPDTDFEAGEWTPEE